MAQYVDGYVIPIKRKNLASYKKLATWGCRVWMKHGALGYYECVADDFVKHGQGFKKMCDLKSGETAIFAFVIYKSKTHRNQVNKKVLKEMSDMPMPKKMPFDMERFASAGCQVLVKSTK
ncbi:MAG: DUF1428 domain-containing protein [Bdellovibrionales bacterium]|nr:DUF1428 domain-containing protein [Bdellovibrionales bacterium]